LGAGQGLTVDGRLERSRTAAQFAFPSSAARVPARDNPPLARPSPPPLRTGIPLGKEPNSPLTSTPRPATAARPRRLPGRTIVPMTGPRDRPPPNTCAPLSETAMSPAKLGLSTTPAAPSRYATPMAATSGPTWWRMVMPGPSSDTVATISTKSAKRLQFGPEYTVTHTSLRGGGMPSSGRSNKLGHVAGSTTTTPKWAAKSPSQLVNKGQLLAALSHASELLGPAQTHPQPTHCAGPHQLTL
jgi:hypothetical protein